MPSTFSATALRDAFVEDHQTLTQGFSRILTALRDGDLRAARQIAGELDRDAGAHIAFEEEVLYPLVQAARGAEYSARLYREHSIALEALRALLAHGAEAPAEADVERALQGMQTGVDHAVSCGTLLSHLTSLPPDEQEQALERLRELRRQAPRWTELAARPRG